MKYLTTLTILLVFASSCKNIEKMVDKGQYDKAISYGVSKLEGKKNKKTKYVKALERAYTKVNQRDLDRITNIRTSDNTARYDKIYDIYANMYDRQKTVLRLDPLISEDGYIADFNQRDYAKLLSATATLAAESHYKEALRLIEVSKSVDKYAARSAYDELRYIEQYFTNYKDSDMLYRVAYNIGMDHIGVDIYMRDMSYTSRMLEEQLHTMDISSLNNFWTTYHLGNKTSIEYDYISTLEVNQIDPGFERELHNTYEESKEIEDGKIRVLDTKGNVVKDSTGQVIFTKKYKKVIAQVKEMKREKMARIRGNLVVYNNRNQSLVRSVPIDITHHFEDYSTEYRGDKRALTADTKAKLKSDCNIFPSDYDMVMAMSDDFMQTAYNILERNYR